MTFDAEHSYVVIAKSGINIPCSLDVVPMVISP